MSKVKTPAGDYKIIGLGRGQIYYVDIPRAHSQGHEQCHDVPCPYIVLSDRPLHARGYIAIVAPLSSQMQTIGRFVGMRVDLSAEGDITNKSPKLDKPSFVLVEQLRVISTTRFTDGVPLGTASPAKVVEIDAALMHVLGI